MPLSNQVHAPQLLKPGCLEPVLCSKKSHPSEKPAHCKEEYPVLASARENLHASVKTQHNQK